MRTIRRLAIALILFAGLGYAWAQLTPVPALPDAERRTTYSVTGQTGPFNVGFALYGDGTDYQNWIQVYVNGVVTTAYTLSSPSGTIGNITLPITDAQITFSSVQTGTVQIIGARRPRRTAQLSENRGVSAHDFNVIITDIMASARERWDLIQNRVLQVPPGETLPMLPPAASRASQNAVFDANGNLTAGLPAAGSVTISAAMQPVVGAATVASAASQLGVSAVPVGTMLPYAGLSAPTKFDFAAGQAYSRINFPDLLTALTSSQTGTCTNSSTTITGLSDTSQFANGQRIEGSRIPSLTNTVVAVLSSTSIQVLSAATSSGSCTIQVFPWGNGDGLTTFNIPDMRGVVGAGRDSMGGTAKNVLQASTTITTTSGSPSATVASGSGIAAGMVVVSANVPAGTTVSSISGTTVTLSGNATATHSGDAVRFSMVADAQALASTGGTITRTMTSNEMPSHAHGITDPGHTHTMSITQGAAATGGDTKPTAGNGSGGTISFTSNSSTTGITINSTGGGAAHITGQPTVAINYIVRVTP